MNEKNMEEKNMVEKDTTGKETVITETEEADEFYILQLVGENSIDKTTTIEAADLENFPINITLPPGKRADVVIHATVRQYDP